MTTFNVIAGGTRNQVLIDEQQMAQLQAELGRRANELERLRGAAFETLTAVNAPAQFVAAAMALCNELASRWKAERVGIGFLKGRYVRLQALSHTEKITRHMQLVQDIEGAMEECLDQDVEVMVPPPKDANFVYRAADQLARRDGISSVCSFPLRRSGNVVAVLLIERKGERPLTLEELETLRLTCDLFTARLNDLFENDRFIAIKAAKATKKGLAWVVGTKHTWAKVITLAVILVALFGIFVRGEQQIVAPFVLDASEKQIVPSPFEGNLKTVNVNLGDMVFSEKTGNAFDAFINVSPISPLIAFRHPPTILATLNTTEYQTKLIGAMDDYNNYIQQEQNARAVDKQGEALMYHDQARGAASSVKLYQDKIDQATIKAPIDGVIFSGDLKQRLNSPVKVGEDLFEVGETAKLRAEISIPDDQITEIAVGQHGALATSSYPGEHYGFTVESINPIATVTGTKNNFKVRVQFDKDSTKLWMRPGMEGTAKIDVGRARYLWIYSHRIIDWVRMKLWIWGL